MCRLCEEREDTIDHVIRECKDTQRTNKSQDKVKCSSGESMRWMIRLKVKKVSKGN